MDVYHDKHLHSVSTHATSHLRPRAFYFLTLGLEPSLHIRFPFRAHSSFSIRFGLRVHLFSFYAHSLWLFEPRVHIFLLFRPSAHLIRSSAYCLLTLGPKSLPHILFHFLVQSSLSLQFELGTYFPSTLNSDPISFHFSPRGYFYPFTVESSLLVLFLPRVYFISFRLRAYLLCYL